MALTLEIYLLDSYLESTMHFPKHQWLKSEASTSKFYLYPDSFKDIRNKASQFDRNQQVSTDASGCPLHQCIVCTSIRPQILLPVPGPQKFCTKGQSTVVCTESYGCRQQNHESSWPGISRKIIPKLSLANCLCFSTIFSIWCIWRKYTATCGITEHEKIIDGSAPRAYFYWDADSSSPWIRSC